MANRLRIVHVGCGGISQGWFKAAAENPAVEVAGIVDLREEAARQRAREFNLTGAAIGTDLKAMLRKVRPAIVFDCTIPEAHRDVVTTALRAGCHVLGEKPLADSMAHARRMVAAAQQAGKLYAVMQNRRYDARIRRLRAFLDSGAIGQPTTFHSDFFIGAHFGGFRDKMKHVLLLDMAIHSFDEARFISGADPVAVYCREWNPAGSWYDHGASAVATFEMSNGLVYTYRGSWCAEGLNTSWQCDWRIVGPRGTVKWDGNEAFQAQAVAKAGGFLSEMKEIEVPAVDPAGKVDGHKGCINDFIRCVQTGTVPETVCTDNIKSLAMVFGAIRSAETGRRIVINPTNRLPRAR
jgi:predicted dehydrogenase